jgi:methylaspartate mutase epsilon subunit
MHFNMFHQFIQHTDALIIQPRMGFSDIETMREGLSKVKAFPGPSIGTITLDSFTRVGDFQKAETLLRQGQHFNGYPLVAHGTRKNRALIGEFMSEDFPIQVRHGSSLPLQIFRAIMSADIDATEGGPVSYCLPYGRTPLTASVQNWEAACKEFARQPGQDFNHIESFGGCMLGQLCPPSILNTITILEALFFSECGIRSVSISYAQGYNFYQDVAALLALKDLAAAYLHDCAWHVVLYTFMGMFPKTRQGAKRIIQDSARLARTVGAQRLIIKTADESRQIPTIESNIEAMYWAYNAQPVADALLTGNTESLKDEIYEESRFLIDLVLNLRPRIGDSIQTAFKKGYLDIPYCLHPDNLGTTKSALSKKGIILWVDRGKIPFPRRLARCIDDCGITSENLLKTLSFNVQKYDSGYLWDTRAI